jgi:hypothetical protein
MAARRQQLADQGGWPPLRSSGRPGVGQRANQRAFWWLAIAEGKTSEDCLRPWVGSRWFREGGVMPTLDLAPSSRRYLSFAEREEIAILRARNVGVREIAWRLGRSPSTISRELRRNAATRGGKLDYRATTAQWHAERQARRPKAAKLAVVDQLRDYVQQRLSGQIVRPDGAAVAGPQVVWIGGRHGRRQDRQWATAWSPEQISNRLMIGFPDDEMMRISHEAATGSRRGSQARRRNGCVTGVSTMTRGRPSGSWIIISIRPQGLWALRT